MDESNIICTPECPLYALKIGNKQKQECGYLDLVYESVGENSEPAPTGQSCRHPEAFKTLSISADEQGNLVSRLI